MVFFRCIPFLELPPHTACSLQRSNRGLENLSDSFLTRPFSSSDRAMAFLFTNGASHIVQKSFVAARFKVELIDAALITDHPRNY